MRKDNDSGKYMLENQLRTWSDLKRQKAAEQQSKPIPQRSSMQQRNSISNFLSSPTGTSPSIPPRKWGGCVEGCNHNHEHYPRRIEKQKSNKNDEVQLPAAAQPDQLGPTESNSNTISAITDALKRASANNERSREATQRPIPAYLQHGRDGGGTTSGAATPNEPSDDDGTGYFSTEKGGSFARVMREAPERKSTPEDIERWVKESGMGAGKHADPLGDEGAPDDEEEHGDGAEQEDNIREEGHSLEDVEEAEKRDRSLRGSVY